MSKRILLVGRAASGKDHYRDYCGNRGFKLDVSYTTRPKREGEKEGYTYNYLTDHQFENMKLGEAFHECVSFNDWQYGTSKDNWDSCKVFIMTPTGVSQISKQDRKNCTIVFFDIDEDIRRERLSKRSDADSVDRRIEADKKDFEGFSDFDLRVRNPQFISENLMYIVGNINLFVS